MTVHGSGEDVRRPNVKCLYCIARFVQNLDGLTVLRLQIPESNSGVI